MVKPKQDNDVKPMVVEQLDAIGNKADDAYGLIAAKLEKVAALLLGLKRFLGTVKSSVPTKAHKKTKLAATPVEICPPDTPVPDVIVEADKTPPETKITPPPEPTPAKEEPKNKKVTWRSFQVAGRKIPEYAGIKTDKDDFGGGEDPAEQRYTGTVHTSENKY